MIQADQEGAQSSLPFQKSEWEELDDETDARYDRQSFIGHEVQKRLLQSNILLVHITGSTTELAKNLVLAGANITILDHELVNESDVQTNFLITKADLGSKRADVAKRELQQMNPLVRIELLEALPADEECQKFSALVTSTSCFNRIKQFDDLSRRLNKPYYNLLSCGYQGFVYISLGPDFKYTREKQQIVVVTYRPGQNQPAKDKEPRYRNFEEVSASSVPFEELLNLKTVPKFQNDLVYYCILAMYRASQDPTLAHTPGKRYSDDELDRIAELGAQVYTEMAKSVDPEAKAEVTEALKAKFRQFAKFYGIDFCPVYSVLGSVISQEIINVVGKTMTPGQNWFCFDSEDCYGYMEIVQNQAFPTRELPELRQLITE